MPLSMLPSVVSHYITVGTGEMVSNTIIALESGFLGWDGFAAPIANVKGHGRVGRYSGIIVKWPAQGPDIYPLVCGLWCVAESFSFAPRRSHHSIFRPIWVVALSAQLRP